MILPLLKEFYSVSRSNTDGEEMIVINLKIHLHPVEKLMGYNYLWINRNTAGLKDMK